jgi:hypothetical protein
MRRVWLPLSIGGVARGDRNRPGRVLALTDITRERAVNRAANAPSKSGVRPSLRRDAGGL